jgi:hypothetical protein
MRTLSLLSLLVFLASCSWLDPEEPVPAYLRVEPFNFSVRPDQGTANAAFPDVWVLAGDEFVGAYTLPADIPLLKYGDTRLELLAGIKENGISFTPQFYPMLQGYLTNVNLVAGETVNIKPSTKYYDDAKFLFMESFENINHSMVQTLSNTSTNQMTLQTNAAFEGKAHGEVLLNTSTNVMEVASVPIGNIPASGSEVFLELNYKNTMPVFIGFAGFNSGGSRVFLNLDSGVNPKATWNKIYFNFTDQFTAMRNAGATSFQLVFRGTLPAGATTGSFTVDNIKVISR